MTITPLWSPIPRPGCYDLALYCKWDNPAHHWDEFPHQVTESQTRQGAERIARNGGWILHRDGLSTCPKCAKELKG